MNLEDIKLVTPSLRYAGGEEAFPDLEVVGVISVEYSPSYGDSSGYLLWKINNALREEAMNNRATHVFGVQYRIANPWTATGTAYAPRKERILCSEKEF